MTSGRPPRYYVRPNHGTRHPAALIFVDTETRGSKPRGPNQSRRLTFRLGCASFVRLEGGKVTRRQTLDFTDPQVFWKWVEARLSPSRPVWLFAHNLTFDLTILDWWGELEKRRFVLSSEHPIQGDPEWKGKKPYRGKLVLEGRPTFAEVLGHGGKLWLIDSLNYFPCSLEVLGRSAGVPKGELPDGGAPDEEFWPYCQQDVRVLETVVLGTLKKWRDEDCGCWQPTAAGLAMQSFRHIAPTVVDPDGEVRHKKPIGIDHTPEPYALEKEGYYGGLVECFYYGKVKPALRSLSGRKIEQPGVLRGPVHHLDVRSLYPAVMRGELFPCRRVQYWRQCEKKRLYDQLPALGGIARVLVNSWENTYPVRLEGHQINASGRFWTTLAGPELLRAVEAGDVEDVGEASFYAMASLFKEWVDYWWERRLTAIKAGDALEDVYCAMILKSLSGKWAQDGKKWVERPDESAIRAWANWWRFDPAGGGARHYRAVGGWVQEHVQGEPPRFAFPAISAFITSYGRELMREYRSFCPPKSVLYQGTDSLFCLQPAADALEAAGAVKDNELGKLDWKGTHADAHFWGQNHYRVGERFVCAGSWGKAEERPGGSWAFEQWSRLQSIIAAKPDGSVLIQLHKIEEPKPYHKGLLQGDGWTSPRQLIEVPEVFQTAAERVKKRPPADPD